MVFLRCRGSAGRPLAAPQWDQKQLHLDAVENRGKKTGDWVEGLAEGNPASTRRVGNAAERWPEGETGQNNIEKFFQSSKTYAMEIRG